MGTSCIGLDVLTKVLNEQKRSLNYSRAATEIFRETIAGPYSIDPSSLQDFSSNGIGYVR